MKEQKGEGIYNVVVIGGGTAGLVTAAGTAGLGGRVALIERKEMGGDCLNFGCVPSKALISSCRLIQQIREAEKWGLDRQEPQFAFHRVFERMRSKRAQIAPNDSQERFESLGVDVFRGEARFNSSSEVIVDGQKLRAKNFVVATGSRPRIPRIEGLESAPFFTNETIFDRLMTKPEKLIVLGGGPIGCELGQALSRLGVQITILQSAGQLLPLEDADVATFMQRRFEAEGIAVRVGTQIKRIGKQGGKVIVELVDPQNNVAAPTADALLVATGRIPNVEGLGLEAAGVCYTAKGIEVNDYMQTSQPNIYAAGDVANRLKFTHTADFTARIVVRNILMPFRLLHQKAVCSIVPWCTFTDPEVAHVGLGEQEAQTQGVDYDLFRIEMADLDRAVVESEDAGFGKILVRKGSDEIIGVTLVASRAGDLLHEFVVAMHSHVGLGRIASIIHAYPTLAEIARKAGDKYNKTRLTPRARKIFSWLYRRARK